MLTSRPPDRILENPQGFNRWAAERGSERAAEIDEKLKRMKKQGPTRLIRFLKLCRLSPDGITPQLFEPGQTAELPEALAIELCKNGTAELLKQFNEPPVRK